MFHGEEQAKKRLRTGPMGFLHVPAELDVDLTVAGDVARTVANKLLDGAAGRAVRALGAEMAAAE